MPFVREFYDRETLAMMTRALKEAMREAGDQARTNAELNVAMANRIMTAVAGGERDLDALKRAALSVVAADQKTPALGSAEVLR